MTDSDIVHKPIPINSVLNAASGALAPLALHIHCSPANSADMIQNTIYI